MGTRLRSLDRYRADLIRRYPWLKWMIPEHVDSFVDAEAPPPREPGPPRFYAPFDYQPDPLRVRLLTTPGGTWTTDAYGNKIERREETP